MIYKLYKILSKFNLNDALYLEENLDKQYIYLKGLYKNLKDENKFLKLIIYNSIVSYQLISKGEEYWKNFSEYFSKNDNFMDFLKKYNPRLLNIKIRRIEKIKSFLENEDILKYKDNLIDLNKKIAKILNQKESDKTIVFSIKMFGYGLRIIGYKIIYPFEIDIPIDNRISKISKDILFWRNLSRKLNIPPLHLDSILWITFGLNDDEINNIENLELKQKILELKEFLNANYSNYKSIRNR